MKEFILPLERGLSVGLVLLAVITIARVVLRKLNAEKEFISWLRAIEGMALGSMLTLIAFALMLHEMNALAYCLGTIAPIGCLMLFEQIKRAIKEVRFQISFRERVAKMDQEMEDLPKK